MTLSAESAACAEMVEKADPDRFAATMAAAVAARAPLWALYAFNIEVARAAYASDEPMIAEMRLQWWVDEIGRLCAGSEGQGEVARALGPVLRTAPGAAAALTRLVEARRWDCWRAPFQSREAFADYLDATAGGLVWASALALMSKDAGPQPGAQKHAVPTAQAPLEAAVRDFAFGHGLANWFDAIPALEARGRSPLPDKSAATVRALAEEGLARIGRARRARAAVPADIAVVLWPGWSARARLDAAKRAPERAVAGRLPDYRLIRAPALIWRSLTGRW